jgi:uncharacterized DUF497 family protein
VSNQANRRKHGLDFADAALAGFAGQTITFEDLRHSSNEPRYLALGTLSDRMVIIDTLRGGATCIISMRKANARERARYQERLGKSR